MIDFIFIHRLYTDYMLYIYTINVDKLCIRIYIICIRIYIICIRIILYVYICVCLIIMFIYEWSGDESVYM